MNAMQAAAEATGSSSAAALAVVVVMGVFVQSVYSGHVVAVLFWNLVVSSIETTFSRQKKQCSRIFRPLRIRD